MSQEKFEYAMMLALVKEEGYTSQAPQMATSSSKRKETSPSDATLDFNILILAQ